MDYTTESFLFPWKNDPIIIFRATEDLWGNNSPCTLEIYFIYASLQYCTDVAKGVLAFIHNVIDTFGYWSGITSNRAVTVVQICWHKPFIQRLCQTKSVISFCFSSLSFSSLVIFTVPARNDTFLFVRYPWLEVARGIQAFSPFWVMTKAKSISEDLFCEQIKSSFLSLYFSPLTINTFLEIVERLGICNTFSQNLQDI